MSVWACVEARVQWCLPQRLSTLFLRQRLSLDQELTYYLAWLANESAGSSCLSSAQLWDHRHKRHHAWLWHEAEGLNHVQMPVEQELYPLSQIPYPCLIKKKKKKQKRRSATGPAFPYNNNRPWVPETTFRKACLLLCPAPHCPIFLLSFIFLCGSRRQLDLSPLPNTISLFCCEKPKPNKGNLKLFWLQTNRS